MRCFIPVRKGDLQISLLNLRLERLLSNQSLVIISMDFLLVFDFESMSMDLDAFLDTWFGHMIGNVWHPHEVLCLLLFDFTDQRLGNFWRNCLVLLLVNFLLFLFLDCLRYLRYSYELDALVTLTRTLAFRRLLQLFLRIIFLLGGAIRD